MSTTHRDKSSGKPRQRSRKIDQRDPKPEAQQDPTPDQRDENQIASMTVPTDVPTNGTARPADVPITGEVEPADARSVGRVVLAENYAVSIQTIANAYRDYTRKSFQESRFLVEKLMGVRSFDKAVEVQTEFARQAYANFVAESQMICELYSELARQTFRPWEGFAATMNQSGVRSRSST